MGFMPKKIEREDLKAGDHVYVFRPGYTHHGIYDGRNNVIHLTRGQSRNGLVMISAPSHPSEGPVELCSLDAFLFLGGDLYRFEYGVNPLCFLTKLWGTCTCASSDPPNDVLYRATSLLSTDGFGYYDLSNNNCEDFALYCKTGLLDVVGSRKTGSSGQIALFVAVITAVYAYIVAPYGFLPTSFTGAALMFCFLICNSRLHFDAGARRTYLLTKVTVEEFKRLSSPDVAWMELSTKWIWKFAVLAFTFWYWTPKRMILLFVRSFLLYLLLALILISYLRNHRFKLYVYVLNNLIALTIWHWTPESNDFQGFRRYLLVGAFAWLLSPTINRSSKLWKFVRQAMFFLVCWYWTPKSTILEWFRFLDCANAIYWKVIEARSHRSMPLIYISDCLSALMAWYWTPEDITLQWVRLFLINVSLCQLVADLRNHRLLPSVYVLNFILARIIWNWTPESTVLLWFRSLLICGLLVLFVINPNFRLKLGYGIDDIIWLFGLWLWTPEGNILFWIRISLLARVSFALACRMHLFLVLNSMDWPSDQSFETHCLQLLEQMRVS